MATKGIESLLAVPLWEETYPAPQVMQARLCIPGDSILGKERPVSVVSESFPSLTGSEISAGTPYEGRKMLGYRRLHHTVGVIGVLSRAGEAFEILARLEKEDPVWRKLARQNKRDTDKLRGSVASQVSRLLFATS